MMKQAGEIYRERLDVLFAALFLTSLGSLVLGNLLMLNTAVLKSSALMWIPCFGILLIFYALSRVMGGTLRGMIATLILAFLLVRLRQPFAAPLFYVMMLSSLIYSIPRFRPRGVPWLNIMAMALLGALVCFSASSGMAFFNNVNVCRAGLVHKDVFFHSALAAMIKNYGQVSTGMHGLVATPYYVMLHHVVALVSMASGSGVFEVFGVINRLLLLPLVMFSVCECTERMTGDSCSRQEWSWAMLSLLIVVPPMLFAKWLVSAQFMISETYLLSICLFVLGLPLLVKQWLSVADLLTVGAATALMAYTKSSTAVMYAGLFGARWLIIGRGRGLTNFMVFAVSAWIALYLSWGLIRGIESAASETYRLNFLQKTWCGYQIKGLWTAIIDGSVPPFWLVWRALIAISSFVLFHFFLSWCILVFEVIQRGFWVSCWSPVAIIVGASIALALFFVVYVRFIDPNATYWFTNPAFFVALPATLTFMSGTSFAQRAKPACIVLLSVAIVVCLLSYRSCYRNSRYYPLHQTRHESVLIDALIDLRSASPLSSVLRASPEVWTLKPVLWGCLYNSGLSREYHAWMRNPWRTAAPLVFPAISERPWIGVIGPNTSESQYDGYQGYCYECYNIDRSVGGVLSLPVLLPGMTITEWSLPEETTP